MSALDEQVGGNHYKKYVIQPWVFCEINKIDGTERHIIEYICRWKDKGGILDLKKVIQYAEMLMEKQEKVEELMEAKVCAKCFDKYLLAKMIDFDFHCNCQNITRCHDCGKCSEKGKNLFCGECKGEKDGV